MNIAESIHASYWVVKRCIQTENTCGQKCFRGLTGAILLRLLDLYPSCIVKKRENTISKARIRVQLYTARREPSLIGPVPASFGGVSRDGKSGLATDCVVLSIEI